MLDFLYDPCHVKREAVDLFFPLVVARQQLGKRSHGIEELFHKSMRGVVFWDMTPCGCS
jgi:hypothetical protein